MEISTKKIGQGIITIDNIRISKGMLIDDLEQKLKFSLKEKGDFCGYTLPLNLIENGLSIDIIVWLDKGVIRTIKLDLGEFNNREDASDFVGEWLSKRGVTEIVGSDDLHTYYKTECGALMPSIVNSTYKPYNNYSISIETTDKVPGRKFSKISTSARDTKYFEVSGVDYKIQRIDSENEFNMLPITNWLGIGPFSLTNMGDDYDKNDRIEIIYFLISKVVDGNEIVLGVVEFQYLAVLKAYRNSELFYILDAMTERLGIVGSVVEDMGCNIIRNDKISPYILLLEDFHNEIPKNNHFDLAIGQEAFLSEMYNSALDIVAAYVGELRKNITLMDLNSAEDSLFDYSAMLEDIYVNYKRFK